MSTPHHTRRTGLGRRVADIVGEPLPGGSRPAPIGMLAGPAVVPMDLVPFPMLVADVTGRARAVNRRWSDLSGLGREGSLGYGWLAVLRPQDRLPLRSHVERVAAGDADVQTEYAWLPPGGAGGGRATWWLASHQRAGERLVGIAVGPVGRGQDPVRAELPALLLSVRALLERLERLVEHLSDAGAAGVQAVRV